MGQNIPSLIDSAYHFTNGWFDGHIAIWARLLDELKPSRVLEIGSYEGKSACYVIEQVGVNRNLEIHCVDNWEGSMENDPTVMSAVESRFDANIAVAVSRCQYPPTVVKHKAPSYRALSHLLASGQEGRFDFIYVDGSHQACDVLSDAVLSFHLLRVGGVLVFDDYLWHMEPAGQQDILNAPKMAIDSFLTVFRRRMQILHGFPLNQIYAVKTAL